MTPDIYMVLKVAALVIVVLFLVFSLDDLFFDFYYYLVGRKRTTGRIRIIDFDTVPPGLIAVFIPAWKEEAVIAPMLENTFASLNYPGSFYHVFVGTYPNDTATNEAVEPLLGRHKNLHLVKNPRPGPTNKANNLNNLLNAMNTYENAHGLRFSIVAIFDSEDVIHPTSLKLFNYLIHTRKPDAIQLPVFPLQPRPTLRNFWKYLTAGTYADEFAENHLRGLTSRAAAKAFVPSAGTGFAISRDFVEQLEQKSSDGLAFDETNLTEDYELSLRMEQIGGKVQYFIEAVRRVTDTGRTVREYIATREFFPNTLQEAVKQKSRWIYGISFQSFHPFRMKGLSLMQKYSIIRDWKAKYANLLLVPGYIIFAYVIVSFLVPLPALFPWGSLSWWLTIAVTILAVERQVLRIIAVRNIYGWRSAAVSCLMPPLLPARYVWGNLINFLAAGRAWRTRLFGSPRTKAVWHKTDHSYPPAKVLEHYRRKLGDLLLEKQLITPQALGKALAKPDKDRKLGEIIRDGKVVSEEQLLPVLGELLKTGYIDIQAGLIDYSLARRFPQNLARKYKLAPLLSWDKGILLATSEPHPPSDLVDEIRARTGLMPKFVFSTSLNTQKAIDHLYSGKVTGTSRPRIGEVLVARGLIDETHFIEALKVQQATNERLGKILMDMNLISESSLAAALIEMESSRTA